MILGRPDESVVQVLSAALSSPKYIYLTRRDRLRQAVSFARAIQTEQWSSLDSVSSEPRYDRDAITAARRALEAEESNWEQFFARHGIRPYRLVYEDLDAVPHDTLAALLRFLGYEEARSIALPSSQLHRQADGETEVWVERYRRERGE